MKVITQYFIRVWMLALSVLTVAASHAQEQAQEKELTNSIGMKLKLIPAGAFTMGSPPEEESFDDDECQHQVTLSKPYFMGVYEVTQAQYEIVMGKNPSYFQGDEVAIRHPETGRIVKDADSSNHPVEQVSWEDAVAFCQILSSMPSERAAGRVYRLPTEAQWEYACRAGTKSAYSFGDNYRSLGEHAWHEDNSGRKTHPVGQKKPNAWGLYDMHGNVWEWCSDGFGNYPRGASTDPGRRAVSGFYAVYRGGSWIGEAAGCRSAGRRRHYLSSRSNSLGFRVALAPVISQPLK